MTGPDPQDEAGRRRRSRAIVMGVLLAAIALLVYAITIAKMSVNQ